LGLNVNDVVNYSSPKLLNFS